MNRTPPPLRSDLEFIPIEHKGEHWFLVRDRFGLVKDGMAIPHHLTPLLQMLNGQNSLQDIADKITLSAGKTPAATDELEPVIRELTDVYLLESDNYFQAKDRIISEFVRSSNRPPACSGRAYPADPDELRNTMSGIIQSTQPEAPMKPVKALVAPHIDIKVGASVYGETYGHLRTTRPSRVIILGIGHQMDHGLFCLTSKDFSTPLGTIKNDRKWTAELHKAGKDILSDNDFFHRDEHSIEFQTIFLSHLFPDADFTILPILTGSLLYGLPDYSREAYLEHAGAFLEKLKRIASDPSTLIISGVDLCHIGPKFGHRQTAKDLENKAMAHDRSLLEALLAMDRENFWRESMRIRDNLNVCGFSAMACLLEILPECTGRVSGYTLWHEESTKSAVSFAGAVFTLK